MRGGVFQKMSSSAIRPSSSSFRMLMKRITSSGSPGGWIVSMHSATAVRPSSEKKRWTISNAWWSMRPVTSDTKRMYSALPRLVSASSSRIPMRTKSSEMVDATRSQSCSSTPFQKLATVSRVVIVPPRVAAGRPPGAYVGAGGRYAAGMPDPDDVLTVERVIPAPPAAIFDLLADPSRHRDIDGSGTVREAHEGSRRLALGDTFGMSMKLGVPYSMASTVI